MKLLLAIALLLLGTSLFAQNRTITGKVISSKDNSPVPGATISVKGTTRGTSTLNDGSFTISAPTGKVILQLSSVGFEKKEITVGESQNDVTIDLAEDNRQLGEVVVTSLGVTKSKRDLNYATQTVETKDLTKARETNIANSLSGKVAGLDIVRSSQGVGSNVRIVLRGDRSFTGSSEAYVIIDGIPGDLGSLNPDDVASINVLKGSSASALYGSDAQNGAIVVTTKKGVAGKSLAVSINSSFQLDMAAQLRKPQEVYAQGSGGNYLKDAEAAWGPKMTGQIVKTWSIDPADSASTYALAAHPDNYKNFFSSGKTFTNGVAVSGGGEKIQSYFSYTNIHGTGIVDNNSFIRHNFNYRLNANLTDKLSFDTKITYFWQKADNSVINQSGEDFTNVNRQITRLPPNIDLGYARSHYQFVNSDGELKQNYWHPHSNGGENPFWVKNNYKNFYESNTVKGLASLTYKFSPNLSLLLRTGVTKYTDNSEERKFFDTYVVAENGYFNVSNSTFTQTNVDFLFSYNKEFGNFKIYSNAGGNLKQSKSTSLSSTAWPLVNENVFTLRNAASGGLSSSDWLSRQEKQSLYGSADISYKKYLILSGTVRNDWSSTLPKNFNSYLFGSGGLTAIISDMAHLPEPISFFKVRGSVAQTGNDPGPYQTLEYFSINAGGSIVKSPTNPVDTLKPEITTSREYGFDLNLLKNRIGIEFTYYKTNSKNQLVQVQTPPASGYSSKFINAGNVQNKGIEITLNITPIQTTNFSWIANINYAKNDNKVISIAPNSPEFVLTRVGGNVTKIVEGRPYGEMYSRGLLRDAMGRPVVLNDGRPAVTGAQSVYLGNSRAKWNGGINNRFTHNDFSLSFLITARMGGRIASFTDANLEGDGLSTRTLAGREGFVVEGFRADGTKNTTSITAEQYWNALGGRNTPAGELFTYSSSNIRLRELVLSYTIPQSKLGKTPIKGASISLTGRNLFFIKNDAKGFDPELVVSTDKGSIGEESFCLPFTRTFGVNLNLNF